VSKLGENMLNELKALIKSPKLWITMIGVALIPALYNLSFLGSMWNPYGNVKDLPVAIVNEDKSASLNNQTLSIGDDMVDTMSKNKDLDYSFVSQKKAEKGLEDGDYYMIITLPEDLSDKASSLMTDNPQKLTIDYQTSAGHSVVASKMGESAMEKLKETVSENITKTYTKAVFKSMSTLQDGLQEASNGGQELSNGSLTLESGSQTITDNLGSLASSTVTFSSGASSLNSGLKSYTDGVSQLSKGTETLSTGLSTYTNGVSTLADGANKIDSQSATLVNGIRQLKDSSSQVQQLVDGANQLTSGLQDLANQTQLSSEKQENIQALIEGLPALNSAIQGLNSSVVNLSTSTPDSSALTAYLTAIATQAQSILASSQTDKENEVAAVKATSAYQSLDVNQQAEITSALSNTPNSTATQAQDILSNVKNIQTALASLQSSNSDNQLAQLQSAISQIAIQSNTALLGSSEALTELSSGLNQVNVATSTQLLPGSSQLANGVSTLNSKLSSGSESLLSGVTAYTGAVTTLSNGANTLSANNTTLVNGAKTLQSGANTLDSNSSQLIDGSNQLESGAQQIASGSSQLRDGSSTLTDGLTSLSTGLTTLTSSLSSASQQLSLVSVSSDNAKAVANPLTTKHTDNDSVKTNGIGMAPYMIAVSLMVVALSTNVIFAESLSGIPTKNRFDWAKQKFFINGLIATAGSVILYGAIHLLGFEANFDLRTLGLIILGALTFMALVTALVGWDDRYGSFISLLMLLLQVGSAGGSYPIELSGKFFQFMNPLLPMSYLVSGLRETISMTGDAGHQVFILFAFLIAFIVLGLIIYKPKTQNA
jgi:putative membrane protein